MVKVRVKRRVPVGISSSPKIEFEVSDISTLPLRSLNFLRALIPRCRRTDTNKLRTTSNLTLTGGMAQWKITTRRPVIDLAIKVIEMKK